MEFMMHHVPDKLLEVVVGGMMAVFAFFSKRTLSGYDRRIQKTEEKQDKILDSLGNVEKQVVRIATKIEDMGK
jgi:helix-turn-helix protein